MPIYSKESLERLRQKVDLIQVIESHIELKKTGAAYKALCPFHDEKSASFTINKGDTHYHCFGCGAHGDAIQFLMEHQRLNFQEAVETLAQKFSITLETIDANEEVKGPNKGKLKEALHQAASFYHFWLLSTKEGEHALNYLFSRGMDLDFITTFMIGLSPKEEGIFRKYAYSKFFSQEVLIDAGLLTVTQSGKNKEFFNERIMFPIHSASGEVIGFSGRKYKETTFGGKYINTSETVLFKKSKVLFGLNYSRKRIAKEKAAIIVEGQLDALRLIANGLNFTVAGQGTAFGEGHVKELLNYGIEKIYLALDADNAGKEAALKIGDLFQKEGIEAYVAQLPEGSDPDSFLIKHGPEEFVKLLKSSADYLTFLVKHMTKDKDIRSPAIKQQLVQELVQQIRKWDHPLLVHESLRKVAHLIQVPENMIGVGQEHLPNVYIKKHASINHSSVDPNRILETDLLRWLLLMGGSMPWLIKIARANLIPSAFQVTSCRHIYQTFMQNTNRDHTCDLLELVSNLDDVEGQLVLGELLQKKVDKNHAEKYFIETIQKILNRNWMQKREELRIQIQSCQTSDEEVFKLLKEFDTLKRDPPKVLTENLEEFLHANEETFSLL